MTVQINHAIVAAYDRRVSAAFFADVFGLEPPSEWGPFSTVLLSDGAHLHYDSHFDAIYARIGERRLEHWADPQMLQPDRFNTNHGGRGVYFRDAAGHFLEVLMRSEV